MQNCFKITILTLYPEAFPGYLGHALAKKAMEKSLWSLKTINIRDFALDKHKKVDDKVFGGGKGLLLKPDVLAWALEYAFNNGASTNLIYPSPKGHMLDQNLAKDLVFNPIIFQAEFFKENFIKNSTNFAKNPLTNESSISDKNDGLTFICGHFEGIDERFIEKYKPLEISIGDYILSGGELSAMVIIDCALRWLPNVLNSEECIREESFAENLLEYPQYTKPKVWENLGVPEILLSGNHKEIKLWRTNQAEKKTQQIRPDLWELYRKK
ncbi:tRNA (guanosine(37)-N(1)-)-methyltransferase [Candidatus Hepatincolaceae symbiont of Richtersius coronifer]